MNRVRVDRFLTAYSEQRPSICLNNKKHTPIVSTTLKVQHTEMDFGMQGLYVFFPNYLYGLTHGHFGLAECTGGLYRRIFAFYCGCSKGPVASKTIFGR